MQVMVQGKTQRRVPPLKSQMPSEYGGKRGTECLSTYFSVPTPLCAGYSVKYFINKALIKFLHHSVYIIRYNNN